ncbi:F-box protein At2g02240 [Linum perenne]
MTTFKRSPPPSPPPPPDMNDLPEDIIANVLSFTSPLESCRLALVSSTFWSASVSDIVWERFLPPDYLSILSRSNQPSSFISDSKKDLFRRLCHSPVLIDGGKKSFSLDKRSGSKCFMISSRDLFIVWGDTPRYWKWNPEPDSRFGEAAELVGVCWLEVKGTIATSMLSPATLYTAVLVFKSHHGAYGFDYQPVEVSVGLTGCEKNVRSAFVDVGIERRRRLQVVTIPRRLGGFGRFSRGRVTGSGFINTHNNPRPIHEIDEGRDDGGAGEGGGMYPKERGDGWFEVELGEFFTKEGEDGELELCVNEVKGGNWKGGLIIQGIEIRPKQGK